MKLHEKCEFGWNEIPIEVFPTLLFLGASLCHRSNFSRIQLEYIWFKQIEYIISKHQSKLNEIEIKFIQN
jgi:hypothetical protein